MLEGAGGVMDALDKIAKRMGDGEVSVGFMEGATYPDGTSVAGVAFWDEFGIPSHGQPPRPFFRNMIAKESPGWGRKLAGALKFTNYDGNKALGIMGADIKGALQQSINDFTTPGLAPSTIAAKGFAKPLIDSSHMLNSVDFEVNG